MHSDNRAVSPLVSVAELAAHEAGKRGPDAWVVVDCRFTLTEPGAGRAAWAKGHIPGARYAHLDEDLAGSVTRETGRHPLPDPERLAQTLGSWGIGPATRVVAYDEGSGAFAARLWWLLRWLGHGPVSVLDGGFAAWTAAGLPVEAGAPVVVPTVFTGIAGTLPTVSAEELAQLLPAGRITLIDVRAPERFRGDVEPIDPVAGHVPGAINMPFSGNLTGGLFKSADELQRLYAPLVAHGGAAGIAAMCGSGVTACHGILALEIAGLPGARLYPGSWSEWIRDEKRPVARGS